MTLYVTDHVRNGPLALIDGDLIVYAAAHSADGSAWAITDDGGTELTWQYKKDAVKYCEENFLNPDDLYQVWNPLPEHHVYADVDRQMNYILEQCNTDRFEVYLTGKDNFRKELTDTYKAHRKDQRKPVHFQAAFDYMINMWDAEVVNGMEADDLLGIRQSDETIICTKDKDLDMIPGKHFNFGRGEMYTVDEDSAHKFFWLQMITGDRADNIWGIPGMGPKRAEAFLSSLDPHRWPDAVLELYEEHVPIELGDPKEVYNINMKLLRILTEMPDGKKDSSV